MSKKKTLEEILEAVAPKKINTSVSLVKSVVDKLDRVRKGRMSRGAAIAICVDLAIPQLAEYLGVKLEEEKP